MQVPATMMSGALSLKSSSKGRATSEMLRTRPVASQAMPMTSTLMASLKLEWWPVQRPMTPPMFSRCRRSPAKTSSGTSPTKYVTAPPRLGENLLGVLAELGLREPSGAGGAGDDGGAP